jgi:hypothetical protein
MCDVKKLLLILKAGQCILAQKPKIFKNFYVCNEMYINLFKFYSPCFVKYLCTSFHSFEIVSTFMEFLSMYSASVKFILDCLKKSFSSNLCVY